MGQLVDSGIYHEFELKHDLVRMNLVNVCFDFDLNILLKSWADPRSSGSGPDGRHLLDPSSFSLRNFL